MASSGTSGVLERLIEDDYLHEQLTAGGDRLLAAYRRARTMRVEEAAKDRKLFEQIRGATAALAESARRIAGRPEPEPPRRRRLPILIVGVGVFALVRSMHRAQQSGRPAAAPAPR
jgi:hypothetical protein